MGLVLDNEKNSSGILAPKIKQGINVKTKKKVIEKTTKNIININKNVKDIKQKTIPISKKEKSDESKVIVKSIKSNIKEKNYHMTKKQFEQKIPSVSIISCGGCGINLAQKFLTEYDHITDKYPKLKTLLIDTSKSNLTNVEYLKNIDLFLVEQGFTGSGKNRSKNYFAIKSSIEKLTSNIKYKLSDINIVVFSLSGGTGSIIAPILIKKLFELDKKVIAIAVSAEESKIDIINDINTLKSLYNITKKHYLPMILTDNTQGRDLIDFIAINTLYNLITIFLSKADEVDYEDKLSFLSPHKAIPGLKDGIHLMTVSSELDINDNTFNQIIPKGVILPDEISSADSIFMLSKKVDDLFQDMNSGIIFKGYDDTLETDNIVLSILSNGISQNFIDHLNDKNNNIIIKTDTDIKFSNNFGDSAIDDNEIIL